MEDLNDANEIVIDEEPGSSAVTDIELLLDCRRIDRVGTPCAPPPAHKSPSSRFRQHQNMGLIVAPYVVDPQNLATATTMAGVGTASL